MTDIAKMEALNADQFATAADRIVFRARASERRLSANKALFANDRGRASRREVAPIPSLVRAASHVRIADEPTERTLYVRAKKFSTSTATGALLASVFAIAIAVTSVV